MTRPLKLDGSSGLIEFSDADIASWAYYLRIAYAAQLNAGGNGSINLGGTGTTIGSASDTSSTAITNSQTRNYSGGADYPAAPGVIGSEVDATYTYKQIRTVPAFPTTATLNSHGYLGFDGGTGLQIVNTQAGFNAEIIAEALNQMKTGDQIGTYRVQTVSPGANWTDKGAWFADTTYSAGTTTSRLYLRTAGTAPTAAAQHIKVDGYGLAPFTAETINASSNLIQQILLPALTRRLSDGDLRYTVSTSTGGVAQRGSWTDTKQTSTATSYSFTNPTYYTSTIPSGVAVTQNTYYLNIF